MSYMREMSVLQFILLPGEGVFLDCELLSEIVGFICLITVFNLNRESMGHFGIAFWQI